MANNHSSVGFFSRARFHLVLICFLEVIWNALDPIFIGTFSCVRNFLIGISRDNFSNIIKTFPLQSVRVDGVS